MKIRPDGFLSKENIDHDSEVFRYIQELHYYLWRIIKARVCGASGTIDMYLDSVVEDIEKEALRTGR